MDEKKVSLTGVLTTGILKGCVNSNVSIHTEILNTSLERGEVISVFKNGDELSKEGYRPVSVFTHASKIFERIVF